MSKVWLQYETTDGQILDIKSKSGKTFNVFWNGIDEDVFTDFSNDEVKKKVSNWLSDQNFQILRELTDNKFTFKVL